MGFEKDFKSRIVITNLYIIGADTFKVYQSNFFRNAGPPVVNPLNAQPPRSRSNILVYRTQLVGDYYYLTFDFFIDFSRRSRMVLKEISASLGMSIFSILAVVILFIITYRNLIERKGSPI